MGYLSDNTPRTSWSVCCTDLYRYRLIIKPGYSSDLELREIVIDVLPDVEEWQFSGRRFWALPRYGPRPDRVILPGYGLRRQNVRVYDERVVFAFHTEEERQAVADRLTTLRYKYEFQTEPPH